MSNNVMRRMGGSMAWGQFFLNQSADGSSPTVLQTSPDMRQLWLDNEVSKMSLIIVVWWFTGEPVRCAP